MENKQLIDFSIEQVWVSMVKLTFPPLVINERVQFEQRLHRRIRGQNREQRISLRIRITQMPHPPPVSIDFFTISAWSAASLDEFDDGSFKCNQKYPQCLEHLQRIEILGSSLQRIHRGGKSGKIPAFEGSNRRGNIFRKRRHPSREIIP